jgi:hypothetical protein
MRDTIFYWGNKKIPILEFPRQCPLALLVEAGWREGKCWKMNTVKLRGVDDFLISRGNNLEQTLFF